MNFNFGLSDTGTSSGFSVTRQAVNISLINFILGGGGEAREGTTVLKRL